MEVILSKIQERLAAEVEELKYIDEDWGQMDVMQPTVKYPCAIIDIPEGNYTNNGELVQQGTLTVAVKCYNLKLTNSSHAAPQRQKDYNKQFWALQKKINLVLHGVDFIGNNYGVLIRNVFRKPKREDGISTFEIYYTIQLTDTSCLPICEEVNKPIQVSISTGFKA